MEILSWELDGGAPRRWSAASGVERLREAVTPRLHGRPSWTPRWVGISPDGQRVASIRDDGTVSLWSRSGQPIAALALPHYAELDPAFAPDGRLLALRASGDGRLAAIDVETGRVVLEVDDRPSRNLRRAALLPATRATHLAVSRPDGMALHRLGAAEAARISVSGQVWRIAMDGNARVVAVATQHRVTLWSLAPRS